MKLYRFAAFLLVIGVSLSFTTFVRGFGTYSWGSGGPISPDRVLDGHSVPGGEKLLLWSPPRTWRMEVYGDPEISFYVYQVDSVTLSVKQVILQGENITRKLYNVQLPVRGLYEIVLTTQASSANYTIDLTLYGPEQDLLQVSIGLVVVGVSMATVQYAVDRRKKVS